MQRGFVALLLLAVLAGGATAQADFQPKQIAGVLSQFLQDTFQNEHLQAKRKLLNYEFGAVSCHLSSELLGDTTECASCQHPHKCFQ